MNRSKCEWFNTSIKLLGHIVSEKGISMDPEKIAQRSQRCHIQQILKKYNSF
jgi:hypothetical protein